MKLALSSLSVSSMLALLLVASSMKASAAFMSPAVTSIRPARQHQHQLMATTTASATERDAQIAASKEILVRAAETKQEDSETVIQALLDLEQLMRQKAKEEGEGVGTDMKTQLNGDWRLIFTTGTKTTQEKYGKITYFPIKAVQTFRTQNEDPMKITNGIFLGDFPLVEFSGEMDFDLRKRKLEFDFDTLVALNFIKLNLGQGEAAKLGASSGLGSESNVENAKRGRQAFFNWISADEDIATARGGGGGLALWKRIPMEE